MGKSECSNFPWLQLFEITDALEYLHSLGFLHNDIKTDNMLLTGDSSALENENENVHVVLCDFGKATEVSNSRHYKLTSLQKQEYYKKHSHIAPEVIEGHYPQSKMSDIFSFGLVFYHVAERFENERLQELAKLCTRSNPCLSCFLTDLKCKIKAYRGFPKKRSPVQKWLTWFIMTKNKDNVHKSCVFVLHRYLCVSTSINCNSYLNIY